ncbi:uncharacterized protein LOC141648862 [Silene latifolia]|uniref:uncharacterized protein LOC141648862 n=1 Tax=Silene latifolia TaxID=37657 RepID=UPI003D781CF2
MTCVRTVSYSLVLNGVNFTYFHGAKELRQGDPISPLLFTVTIEYLSRILDRVTTTMKFHPLCGQLRLSHLLFADDLLLFSKGDSQSIMILLRAFATFSVATGLQMNAMKSNIYILMESLVLLRLTFPKYRALLKGIPLLNIWVFSLLLADSLCRTELYWATIFGIPGGVLRRINAIYRNYLWYGSTEYLRSPMVSWDKHCIYTVKLLRKISVILNIRLPNQNPLMWVQAKPWAKLKKMVINARFRLCTTLYGDREIKLELKEYSIILIE